MIELNKVTYGYAGADPVLTDLNLTIKRGERVAVVGNNGSGKTTMVLLINGILKATSGAMKIAGLDPSDQNDNRLLKQRVGLVFQNPDNQLVSTTVEREVAFALENINVKHPDIRERVKTTLKQFGLYEMRDRLTSELSGGEKQKLALAAVMVGDPDILILDEPGSYLDESGKKMLEKALTELIARRPELTIIHITQYVQTAQKYNRVICFENGEIIADNSPEDILSDPNLYGRIGIDFPFENKIRFKEYLSNVETNENESNKTTGDKDEKSIELSFDGKVYEKFSLRAEMRLSNKFIYGLVGPSAAGKTTALQLLRGLIKPYQGEIRRKINDRKTDSKSLNLVTISFQQPERQFFLDTVNDEIEFGARNMGYRDIDSITEECYRLTGLNRKRFEKMNPFDLSGGEKRRLAFASILSLKPDFVFFDEPSCGLDAVGVRQYKKLVKQLQVEGVGIMIVSHDGDLIFELADKIIVLRDGQANSEYNCGEFFNSVDYGHFLSQPDMVIYQQKKYNKILYYNEQELIRNESLS